MGESQDRGKPGRAEAERKERLAAELRANLARRKAQARARRGGEADRRREGVAVGDEERPAGQHVSTPPTLNRP